MITRKRALGFLWLVLTLLTSCQPTVHSPSSLGPGHWFKPTSEPAISSPIAWDFDGDGFKEIAIGSWDGYFYLLDRELNDLDGWPLFSPDGYFASPALADLDGDELMEILVGSDSGHLHAWNHDGSPVPGFPVDLGYQIWSSPTVLDGPLVAIGGSEQMFLLGTTGHPEAGWPQAMPGWADATAATDGQIIAITSLTPGDPSQGWLTVWMVSGDLLPGFPMRLPLDSDSSPALADFDGDGRFWIVFGDDGGWLHAVDTEGHERSGFPVRSIGPVTDPTPTPHPPGGNAYSIEASPAVADINNDGRLEIAVGAWDGRMYLWDDEGHYLPGWPVQVTDQIISSAALVDLDEDGNLDIVVGSKDGYLYGWTAEARPLPGFPYNLGASIFSSPWVGDLEGDGRADIVVGANNGIHLLQDVGFLGQQAWPTFHRDEARTGAER